MTTGTATLGHAPRDHAPRVAILPLGGTIACVADADQRVSPVHDDSVMTDVLRRALSPSAGMPVTTLVPVVARASAALTIADVIRTLDLARGSVRDGCSGVVVTTGTDTLEEVAFAMDIHWDLPEPLVLTGAMRDGTRPGADGPGNLRDAMLVAAHPGSIGGGVLVTMSGQIHQAWQVRKTHTSYIGAVTSTPVGEVHEDTVLFTVRGVLDRP